MTKLSPRAIVRETHVLERTCPIVVELHPRVLKLRLKGERDLDAHVIPYDVLLDFARKRTYAQTRAVERTAAKRRSV